MNGVETMEKLVMKLKRFFRAHPFISVIILISTGIGVFSAGVAAGNYIGDVIFK